MLRRIGSAKANPVGEYDLWKKQNREVLKANFRQRAEAREMAEWDKDGKHLTDNMDKVIESEEDSKDTIFCSPRTDSGDEEDQEDDEGEDPEPKNLPVPVPSNRERWAADQQRAVFITSPRVLGCEPSREDDVVSRVMAKMQQEVGLALSHTLLVCFYFCVATVMIQGGVCHKSPSSMARGP